MGGGGGCAACHALYKNVNFCMYCLHVYIQSPAGTIHKTLTEMDYRIFNVRDYVICLPAYTHGGPRFIVDDDDEVMLTVLRCQLTY